MSAPIDDLVDDVVRKIMPLLRALTVEQGYEVCERLGELDASQLAGATLRKDGGVDVVAGDRVGADEGTHAEA